MSPRSTALSDLTISRPALPGEFDAARSMGFRRCYRRPNVHHGVGNLECDCLRVEIPVEARAKGSGRLATPERNHDCDECGGAGKNLVWVGLSCEERCCSVCSGTGEFNRFGKAVLSDRFVRRQLARARAAGLVGRREP